MIPALVADGTGSGPAARTSERRQKYGSKSKNRAGSPSKASLQRECSGLPCTGRVHSLSVHAKQSIHEFAAKIDLGH